MKKIAFAGSFDPITKGHLWVVEQGLNIADEVIILIAKNDKKTPLFSNSEKKEMILSSVKEMFPDNSHRITTETLNNEYAADKAKSLGADYMIRGIRNSVDFDEENLIQQVNTEVIEGAKTIFVIPPRDLGSVSSSFIKSMIGPRQWQEKIKSFVTTAVFDKILEKYVADVFFSIIQQDNFSKNIFSMILENYSNPERKYHNLEHIVSLLSEAAGIEISKEEKSCLQLAIIYHDLVYNLKSSTNEEDSATLFKKHADSFVFKNGIEFNSKFSTYFSNTYNAIIDTNYAKQGQTQSLISMLMQDLDLSILGQKESTYKTYSNNIQKEYGNLYDKNKRIEILEFFIQQAKDNKLFKTIDFQQKYNLIAIKNMETEINLLKT